MSSSRPSVLLVDSVPDNREMFAAFLSAEHFVVLQATTTNEALRVAPHADVIVTGIQVDGTFDGIELVRQLRNDAQTTIKPLIVLTACATEPDQQRAHAAGCDLFLPKPWLPETLSNAIRDLLTKGRELREQSVQGQKRASDAAGKSKELVKDSIAEQQRSQDLLNRDDP